MVGKVENIIKNEHQFLHKLYKHYSGLGISDEPELVEKVYTMDVKQFLQLCKVRPALRRVRTLDFTKQDQFLLQALNRVGLVSSSPSN